MLGLDRLKIAGNIFFSLPFTPSFARPVEADLGISL